MILKKEFVFIKQVPIVLAGITTVIFFRIINILFNRKNKKEVNDMLFIIRTIIYEIIHRDELLKEEFETDNDYIYE